VRMVRRDCDLPPSLEVEIQRALKKRPGDRHATLLAFAEAIRSANREDDRATVAFDMKNPAVQREIAARLAAAEAARAPSAPAAAVAPAAPVAAPAAPKSSKLMLIAALVVIVVLGVGVAVLMQREPEKVVVPQPVIVQVPVVADAAPPAPDVAEPDTQDTVDTEDVADAEEDAPPDAPAEAVRPKPGHTHGPVKVRDTPPDTKTEEPKKGNHPAVF